ncbi:MAG: ROK family transcriptional regulator [Acidimicrobiales bacterium]
MANGTPTPPTPGGGSPFARRGAPRRKAVPGDTRRHNRSLVLRTIFRSGPLSRADLARSTHLTRAATSELAAELLAEGLVEQLGTRSDQGVGKPATLLGLVPDARLTVTLDLSDDARFRAALVDLGGKVLDRRTTARDGRRADAALDLATELCVDLADAAAHPLLGVGVGSPGVVDPAGIILEAPNLGWHRVELSARLAQAVEVPVHVANDANAAALGELGLGGPGERSLFLVKIGHGVGAGLVLDGHLVVGDRFAAGEIGHVVVDPDGAPCACGRTGCLETAVAAPRLRRSNDRERRAGGRRLGEALAPVVSALNLREIVLSGPLDLLDESFRAAALDAIRERTMPAVGDYVDIRLSSLGEDDVLLGAAMLVLDRELGVA